MKITTPPMLNRVLCGLFSGAYLLMVCGCASNSNAPQPLTATPSAAPLPPQPAPGQPVFNSDADVVTALLAAVKAQDHEHVHQLLGPAWKELASGDKVQDAEKFKDFATRAAEHMRIEKKDDSTSQLRVGSDDWLFPIPIAKDPAGKWFLDTEAGKAELFARRIGQNELDAIRICRLYVKAQHEYANENRDGSSGLIYAQRLLSSSGKHDGLYWDAPVGQPQSPFARLIAEEKLEGYEPAPGKHLPYHGYNFRVLKRQGPDAAGGKLDYLVNGNMTRGFALIAYPAVYESSGIMTFIVNQEGIVLQKDLGADTTHVAQTTREYNPDKNWAVVND